ncbi:dTDP-4-dehydrorhamnose reductase family protein [Polynucleobacter sp.]|uniref:dTDP-4-dehydrorhamnose reductase family protein n=1 Tax=Polynucleobacter sp. TaxID=2029855 RepID=UPI003F69DB62
MKVLVLGASGMIGNAIYKSFSAEKNLDVYGSFHNFSNVNYFSSALQRNLMNSGDLSREKSILAILEKVKPQVVINCVGLTKHKKEANNLEIAMPINAYMPHKLALACDDRNIRFIHISSDCVFSGANGGYVETDTPDALDIYGRSKAMGEVMSGSVLTLRTSTIGHELCTNYGLLDWFLSQDRECLGFSRAIFSGLPSVVFAEVIMDFVLPNPDLRGLYHISSDPINKYELLELIAKIYGKKIKIKQDREFTIDRSLNYEKFRAATGYIPAAWPDLIETMYKNHRADIHYV